MDPRPGEDSALAFALGDITHEITDAIVNPAGAGLVDLSVRRAAGPELLEELHRNAAKLPEGRLVPGAAVLTRGFGLSARHVIHCGPPVYADGPDRARADLASCHARALQLAREHAVRSIAFPAVGTGMHRFPVVEAAEIAVRTVAVELSADPRPILVRFVLFHPSILDAYVEAAVVALKELPARGRNGTAFRLRRTR